MVDARDGLLKGISNSFNFVLPALNAAQNWGVLDKSRHGEKLKKNFKYTTKCCLSSLDGKLLLFFLKMSVLELWVFQVLVFRGNELLL